MTWDVSSLTDMSAMFEGALSFNNKLYAWDVSRVIDMWQIVGLALAFNRNLSARNVSSMTDMSFIIQPQSIDMGRNGREEYEFNHAEVKVTKCKRGWQSLMSKLANGQTTQAHDKPPTVGTWFLHRRIGEQCFYRHA
jgi:hypothetical protein